MIQLYKVVTSSCENMLDIKYPINFYMLMILCDIQSIVFVYRSKAIFSLAGMYEKYIFESWKTADFDIMR